MGTTAIWLVTLANIIACLILPKLLYLILVKSRVNIKLQSVRTLNQITSFPYCTSYPVTGTPFCKFSPKACGLCTKYI